MAEQTFRSPGFFEQEIDLSQRQQEPVGVPAGVIGTSEKGPAFVPITVGSFPDFTKKFGSLDVKKFGPYAVREFLKSRNAATFLRVLGAGTNESITDVTTTRTRGTVSNAGFSVAGNAVGVDDGGARHRGAVQILAASHFLSGSEASGFPIFSDNQSFDTSNKTFVNVVRGIIMVPSGTRIMVLNGNGEAFANNRDDQASISTTGDSKGKFKLVISSSTAAYAITDGFKGAKILTASLDPSNKDYIGRILNTDPEKFIKEEHLLYADFALEDEIATVSEAAGSVVILSGSALTSADSGDTTVNFRDLFGRFDTRFTTPKTPNIISQPFGKTEYDLFKFESLSDGAWANSKLKVSISNIRMSTDPNSDYGTFAVLVRDFEDNDYDPKILERFPNCSLNPSSENYIARVIGDKKASYDFDADVESERRLVISGKYPNKSSYVRVVMNDLVETKKVPAKVLPFGFRGVELLKTSETLTDSDKPITNFGFDPAGGDRLRGLSVSVSSLTGSILPPIPFRYKVTRGTMTGSAAWQGEPSINEVVDGRLYWGVKFEKLPTTASVSDAILNANASSTSNPLISSFSKFLGIRKLDALITGSGADEFNNNKFTLARVAFSNNRVQDLTASVADHMREVAYIRDGNPTGLSYTVAQGGLASRITFASLVSLTSSMDFNRFVDHAKFSTFFYGGFDGTNILDKDAAKLNDRASSSDTGGNAASSFVSPGLANSAGTAINVNGTGKTNNAVFSYRTATRIMSDPWSVNSNLLAIPGIRDSFVTDYAADKVKDYSLAAYIMDIPKYDDDNVRLFDESTAKPNVQKTSDNFDSRALDNNYVATYFPDVVIEDPINNRKIKVPSSIAALSALGFNDKVAYPWFSPAGFNRAALDFVTNVDIRLNSNDRDILYDARINPIATFPRSGFVIFGQKTLQQAKSALDRVNVRRMLLEIKRIIVGVSRKFVFEQNTPETRSKFVSQVVPLLALVQSQSGIEMFKVVMDSSNNTQEDVEANRLNGRIVVVPTRTIEFISMDFLITSSGVSFES